MSNEVGIEVQTSTKMHVRSKAGITTCTYIYYSTIIHFPSSFLGVNDSKDYLLGIATHFTILGVVNGTLMIRYG